MKRSAIIIGVVLVGMMCADRRAIATVGWAEINLRTIQGDWVCLDHVTGSAFRLRVTRETMVLAITTGPRESDLLLRGSGPVLKEARISSKMREDGSGVESVQIEATGRATEERGKLTVRLTNAEGFFAPWLDGELVFVKEGKESIAERLRKNDLRAKALIEEASAPSSGARRKK